MNRLRELSPIEVSLSGAPKNKSEKFLLQKGGGALLEKTIKPEGDGWALFDRSGSRLGLFESEEALADRERDVSSFFRLKVATKNAFGDVPSTTAMWNQFIAKSGLEETEAVNTDSNLDDYWHRAAVWMYGAGEPEARAFLTELGLSVKAAETKTEDGESYPAAAYAYVPDPEKPSTWKLRLWESPEKKVTARQVGMAAAALGKGFRGNKAELPDADRGKVVSKVKAAWKQANPDADPDEMPEVLKSLESEEVEKATRVSGTLDADQLYGVDNKDYGKSKKKAPKEEKSTTEADDDEETKAKHVGPSKDSPEGMDSDQENGHPTGVAKPKSKKELEAAEKAKHVQPKENELADDSDAEENDDEKKAAKDDSGKKVTKAARSKKGRDDAEEAADNAEDSAAGDNEGDGDDDSEEDVVEPKKKQKAKERIDPEDDDDPNGVDDDGDGPEGQEYNAERDTESDDLGEEVEAEHRAEHARITAQLDASRKPVGIDKAMRKKKPKETPEECDPASGGQSTTMDSPGDMGGSTKSAKRGTSVDAPRDDGSDDADETANGRGQGDGETPGEYRDDLPKEQAEALKQPKKRGKSVVASTDVLSRLQKSAADMLDEGDLPGAQRLMLIGKNLKRLLPDGGFVVMDPNAPVPTGAPVEGLGAFVKFDDLAPNENFLDDIRAFRSVVAGSAPVEKSVIEPVKFESVPDLLEEPGVKDDDEGSTMVDAFASVVKSTLRSKSLSRQDKLATIQEAINALAPSVVKLVEATTPVKDMDIVAMLKSMIDERDARIMDEIATLSAGNQVATKAATSLVPVSKSLRALPGMVEEVRPAGPMKIEDLVRKSMGLTNRNGY